MRDSFKRLLGVLVAATLASLLGACTKTVEWDERVRFHDGTTLVVERGATLARGSDFINLIPDKTWVVVPDPASGKPVRWKADYFVAFPLILERKDNVLYLVTDAGRLPAYQDEGCPTPPYLFWRLERGAWRRISVGQYPWGAMVRLNLFNAPEWFARPGNTPKNSGRLQMVGSSTIAAHVGVLDPEWVQRQIRSNINLEESMEISRNDPRAFSFCRPTRK